jgi:hypothetical protein
MAEEKDGLPAKARRKLVESEERWAREGRLPTGRAGRSEQQRLPPGRRKVSGRAPMDPAQGAL